jgi:N-acetylmuramoyl-L-alanine amidase
MIKRPKTSKKRSRKQRYFMHKSFITRMFQIVLNVLIVLWQKRNNALSISLQSISRKAINMKNISKKNTSAPSKRMGIRFLVMMFILCDLFFVALGLSIDIGMDMRGLMGMHRSLAAAEISNLRMSPHMQHDRIVLELSAKAGYKVFYLDDPSRIVVDFTDIQSFKATPFSTKNMFFVRQVRYGRKGKKGLRIVFDLKANAVSFKAILLKPHKKKPYRLVIDLFSGAASVAAKPRPKPKTIIETKPKPNLSPRPKPVYNNGNGSSAGSSVSSSSSMPSIRIPASQKTMTPKTVKYRGQEVPLPVVKNFKPMDLPVIVIDPGHGGKDPGAQGRCGPNEKKITLRTSTYLYDLLKKSGDYEVYLTRRTDRYISLKYRKNFALKKDADLFISIHADSLPSKPTARGFSVYTVSDRASDSLARSLMRNENQTDQIFGLEKNFKAKDDVRNVLVDLAQNDTKNQSKTFATVLLGHMKKVRALLENPHRHAGFYVLKIPNVPSVLIELGFISNHKDCRYLSDRRYLKTLAGKMKKAIDDYYDFDH